MPTPVIGYPSGTNTYIPNHEASNSLVVGYSRSVGTFGLPQYSQYVPARNNQGWYFVWASRNAARVINADDNNWSDGDVAPSGLANTEGGDWYAFATKRKAYAFAMGRMAVEQAAYPIMAAHAGMAAQQAMTARTLLAYNALSGASWGTHTAAVNGTILTSGQNWKTGSVGFPSATEPGANIKVSLQYGEIYIHQATIGTVTPNMMTLVVNPKTAQAMAASTEIQDYIKQSQFALAQMRGDVPNQNGKWGLPTMLYNHPVVVEDAVRVTSRKGAATETLTYVMADGEAYLLARQGELEGLEGTPSFSTMQIFFYVDELTVYNKYDGDNERYVGRVVTNFVPIVVSTFSGFKFTACLT